MANLVDNLQSALADRYRILRELGQGGMGVVFLALDLRHERKVALKVLRPDLAQAIGADRFLREIRITARLSHPNILTLIDSGNAGGFMYYVTPYVQGESLHDRLVRERQLPLDEAMRITREAADALAYAHREGVVHRDIKPENILLASGHAVVTDFGIAQAVNDAGGEALTRPGLALGTPAYMSPEQATASGPVDGRSDLYSLACVTYEMLAGDPPYSGNTPQAIIARKTSGAVPGLRVVRSAVPRHVESVILRALEKVPADRYATAEDFARALSERGGSLLPRARRLGVPRPRYLAAGATLLLAVVAYVAVMRYPLRPSSGGVIAASVARLTADPGTEWFPSFSPDGEWLVYAGEAAGNRDVYLQGVGGEKAIDLTADCPVNDDQPAFSPDGEHIAFRSERDGGGLFVMGRTGEAVRRLTRRGYRPSWSPDGAHIAFATENVDLHPQNSGEHGELWVVDVSTGASRRITDVDAAMPSWSPHGQRIAFLHRLGATAGGHVWTVPAAGGAAVPATSGAGRDWSPAWSSDGTWLYYVSDRGGSMNLWRVHIDEQSGRPLADPEPVPAPGAELAHVAVSADGRRIAYTNVLTTSNVQRSAFDPVRGGFVGEPEWVTHGSRQWSNPDPSPDGRNVVFYSLTEPQGDLYVMNAGGTGAQRQLTGDSAYDRLPRWSPDGKWIAVFSDRSGPLQVWKIHPDGSGLTQVTDAPVLLAFQVWSPDGKRMVAASPGGSDARTLVFDPNRPWPDQQPQALPPPPDSLAPFAPNSWSPDGRRLAGMISGTDRGIITYTFQSHAYRRLTAAGQWPVWLPDGRRILFVSGGKDFYVVDRVSGAEREVFSVTRDVIGPPMLSRDGRSVYFVRRVTEGDIWVMTIRP